MKKFLRNNGLTLVVLALFLTTYAIGQVFTGWHVYNDEREENGESPVSLGTYLTSAHFLEATGENWESEFLQMFLYVYITTFLFQKGSAESNDPDNPDEHHPVTPKSPWPVRRGGLWKKLYGHSLSGAFAFLFSISFALHGYGSLKLENEERGRRHLPAESALHHMAGSKFWFESFQNWQSEFLSIGAMVVLSIFLREKGSPESKSLEAAHDETGD